MKRGLLASRPDGHQEGSDSCVCVCVSLWKCASKIQREIGTDCVQHLSSLDTTTKEKEKKLAKINVGYIKLTRGKT